MTDIANDSVKESSKTKSRGLIHIYYGEGKGKTTAAMGLVARAAGNDKKVLLSQFVKGRKTGELNVFGSLANIAILRDETTKKFVWEMTPEELEEYNAIQLALFKKTWNLAVQEDYDLLVLDEFLYVLKSEIIEEQTFLELLRNRPQKLEVVMTGRPASETLIEASDYVTEMVCVKHPFDNGVKQRKGIEF